jgi:hypothetical protein
MRDIRSSIPEPSQLRLILLRHTYRSIHVVEIPGNKYTWGSNSMGYAVVMAALLPVMRIAAATTTGYRITVCRAGLHSYERQQIEE